MASLPILAVSSADLARRLVITPRIRIVCGICREPHALWSGWKGSVNAKAGFYTCGRRVILAGIDGRLLPGLEMVGEVAG